MAQAVKSPPAVRETWVQSLGWEDRLEEGVAMHPVLLPRKFPCTEEPGMLIVRGVTKSQTQLSDSAQHRVVAL